MILLPNTTFSDSTVRYLIAQYTRDPFRRESRNVGVVVEKGGYAVAQFVGESEPGEWDIGKLRSFNDANAYRLWVDHWRKLLTQANGDWAERLLGSHSQEFAIVSGGEVRDTGADAPQDVCDYLFKRLVSTGGLAEALSETDEEEPAAVLKNDIVSVIRALGILGSSIFTQHPVYANWGVQGTQSRWHTVALYQETKVEAWAMEPVDFAMKRKRVARDHAAYVRYVFNDIREQQSPRKKINTIALVRIHPEDASDKDVEKGLEILRPSCKIVGWLDEHERQSFLDERNAMANAV